MPSSPGGLPFVSCLMEDLLEPSLMGLCGRSSITLETTFDSLFRTFSKCSVLRCRMSFRPVKRFRFKKRMSTSSLLDFCLDYLTRVMGPTKGFVTYKLSQLPSKYRYHNSLATVVAYYQQNLMYDNRAVLLQNRYSQPPNLIPFGGSDLFMPRFWPCDLYCST